ncbi:MAG: type I secretion system permease/ATPase [Campylobacteraceae bacterium]|nr:type I secretion system permease/ATPase [Campylobacteraceae bacterium]
MNELYLNKEFEDSAQKDKTDTLLESLLFLSKYYKRRVSKESILSGLATYKKKMSLSQFIKAAKKIGLISRLVYRKIDEIDRLALPVLSIDTNNKVNIIMDIDIKNNKVSALFTDISYGEITTSLDEYKKTFSGNILIIKSSYNFRNRLDVSTEKHESKKWFFSTMRKIAKIYYLVILATVFINIFVLAIPLFTMNVYDRVLPNKATETLWVLAIGVIVVIVFDFILKLLRAYFIEQAGKRADIRMSNTIFDHLLNIKLDSKPASTGMFVSRLQSFESVREFFTTATITAFVDLPFVALFIFIIFYIGGDLGYVSLFTAILAIIFSLIMQSPIKDTILKSFQEEQIKQTVLTETVSGLEIIKSVKAENRMRTHWEKSISQTSYFANKAHYLSQVVTYFVSSLAQLSSITIVIVGVLLANEGLISMGVIIAAMILNSRVIAPVSQIASMLIRLDRTIISLKNIDEIMNMPVEREASKHYLSRPYLDGDIHFKNVCFAYKEQNFKILDNINIKIKKGEKIGIIGKVGSGKSTLIKLLMNLYETNEGSILVDNTELRQIDPVDLRKAIGYVPQEPFLFMGSIKDNITIGDQFASDEEILKAAKISGVHDFIGKHQAGYDLLVGERGEGLSGGEKQIVTLARALVSDPNILILDEPTNSMDDLSENIFKRNLKSIIENKTLILITHKPSMLSLVDRLIVINDGKIIADGQKEQIIARFADSSKLNGKI